MKYVAENNQVTQEVVHLTPESSAGKRCPPKQGNNTMESTAMRAE